MIADVLPWQYVCCMLLTFSAIVLLTYYVAKEKVVRYGYFQLARAITAETVYVTLFIWGAGGLYGFKHYLLLGLSLLSVVLALRFFWERKEIKAPTTGAIVFGFFWMAGEFWLLLTGGR